LAAGCDELGAVEQRAAKAASPLDLSNLDENVVRSILEFPKMGLPQFTRVSGFGRSTILLLRSEAMRGLTTQGEVLEVKKREGPSANRNHRGPKEQKV